MSTLGLLLILASLLLGAIVVLTVRLVLGNRHRNVPMRFVFESSTRTAVGNLRSRDDHLASEHGRSDRSIRGANSTLHLQRVQKILVR